MSVLPGFDCGNLGDRYHDATLAAHHLLRFEIAVFKEREVVEIPGIIWWWPMCGVCDNINPDEGIDEEFKSLDIIWRTSVR